MVIPPVTDPAIEVSPVRAREYDRPLSGPSTTPPQGEDPPSFYEAVGGEATFRGIVGRFYAEVAADEVLSSVYPEADLGPAEDRLGLFLMQYWGGPPTYAQQRGHPRLRLRHAPFRIGPIEREAWLRAMRVAVEEAGLTPTHRDQLMNYFEMTAEHMVNAPG